MAMMDTDLGQRLWLLSSAFKAWREDVSRATPAMIKSAFQDPEPEWIIELGAEHLSVLERRDGSMESAAELHDWQDQEDALASFLMVTGILSPKTAKRGVVSLQSEMLMKRSFSLPLQAEVNLSRLLAAQLDTLTPFIADEALVGWRVTERHLSQRRLQIDLYVAPQAKLLGLAEVLRQASGLEPVFCFSVADDPGNPVKLRKLSESQTRESRSAGLLTLITLGLLVLAQLIPITLLDQKVSSLEDQIAANQAAVGDSLRVKQKLDDLNSSLSLLSDRNLESRSRLMFLRSLTDTIPDSASVDRILQTKDKVEINGMAADAYALLGLLQELDGVIGGRFLAPVVADEKIGKHRFRLALTLEDQ
jgi:general secretion pathway protein L